MSSINSSSFTTPLAPWGNHHMAKDSFTLQPWLTMLDPHLKLCHCQWSPDLSATSCMVLVSLFLPKWLLPSSQLINLSRYYIYVHTRQPTERRWKQVMQNPVTWRYRLHGLSSVRIQHMESKFEFLLEVDTRKKRDQLCLKNVWSLIMLANDSKSSCASMLCRRNAYIPYILYSLAESFHFPDFMRRYF